MKSRISLRTPQKFRAFLPRPVKSVLREASVLLLFTDLKSTLNYIRVCHPSFSKELPETCGLRIRQLDNQAMRIRTRGADYSVVYTAFVHQSHLPPAGLRLSNEPLILDLGANIGCTMAHMAVLFPNARIIGVELDKENALLCKENISKWSDRCTLVEAGIWFEDGEIKYSRPENHQDAFRISDGDAPANDETHSARSISLSTLLNEYCQPYQAIDYLKMDIEGAERTVLRTNTDWAERVRCIKVELHEYAIEDCISDLQHLGFEATADGSHNLCVVGVRN